MYNLIFKGISRIEHQIKLDNTLIIKLEIQIVNIKKGIKDV